MNRSEYDAAMDRLRDAEAVILLKVKNDPRIIDLQKALDEAKAKYEALHLALCNEYGYEPVIDQMLTLLLELRQLD